MEDVNAPVIVVGSSFSFTYSGVRYKMTRICYSDDEFECDLFPEFPALVTMIECLVRKSNGKVDFEALARFMQHLADKADKDLK